jgi:GNAT superfamily N-acetyltransferase
MKIRQATYNDAEQIAILHGESWRKAYQGIMNPEFLEYDVMENRKTLWQQRFDKPETHQYVWVAEEGEELLGFICVYGKHDLQWGTLIDNLHVRQTEQQRGVGKQLIREAALWVQKYHSELGLYLHVVEENMQARRFYEKIGAEYQASEPWQSPDGQTIPELLCVWRNLEPLLK